MFLTFLLFLPTLIQSNKSQEDLIHRFAEAITNVNVYQLLSVLHENFTIYDCNGALICDRSWMIKELQKFPREVNVSLKSLNSLDVDHELRFRVNVSDDMVNEYELVKIGDTLMILSERQLTCPKSISLWYSTSLIDYDQLFKDVALALVDQYKGVIAAKGELDTILDRNYSLLACGFRTFTRDQLDMEIWELRRDLFTIDLFDYQIRDVYVDQDGELTFTWDGKTMFRARYFSEHRKYMITSELQSDCHTPPHLTFLLDEYTMADKKARSFVMMYYCGMKKGCFLNETLIEPIQVYECYGDKNPKNITLEQHRKNKSHDFEQLQPRERKEVDLFYPVWNFTARELNFYILPRRAGYPKEIFNIDMETEKGTLKNKNSEQRFFQNKQ